jgi:hypothetical protein
MVTKQEIEEALRSCDSEYTPCKKVHDLLERILQEFFSESEEDKMIEHAGLSEYECSHCHVTIKDEIFYIVDKPIKYCPCCGEKVTFD